MQNAFCESFNGRMRDELLNETLFLGLRHAARSLRAGPPTTTPSGLTRGSATSRRRQKPPSSPQRAIGCATPTSSADRPLLHLRQTAYRPAGSNRSWMRVRGQVTSILNLHSLAASIDFGAVGGLLILLDMGLVGGARDVLGGGRPVEAAPRARHAIFVEIIEYRREILVPCEREPIPWILAWSPAPALAALIRASRRRACRAASIRRESTSTRRRTCRSLGARHSQRKAALEGAALHYQVGCQHCSCFSCG